MCSVPLSLPPGGRGFLPELELLYRTTQGNGPFGLGWDLALPEIRRQGLQGTPSYDGGRDTFLYTAAGEVCGVGEAGNTQAYRARIEGRFDRLEHHREAGNDFWEVRHRDGRVDRFGTARPLGAGAEWRDEAVLADPHDPRRVYAWRLTRSTDSFGNRIDYHYRRAVPTSRVRVPWEEILLAEVRCLDYGDPDDPRFLVTVGLDYEERPDPLRHFRAGFEVRTTRRCRRITVTTHAGQPVRARTYHLGYQDAGCAWTGPPTGSGISLLTTIRTEGHDGERSEWLPPVEFGYQPFRLLDQHRGPVTRPRVGAVVPLLNRIDNHMGRVTHVEYAAVEPAVSGVGVLPLPVVARIEVTDCYTGGSHTTEYRYRHASWHGHAFRGFGRVDERQTEAFRIHGDAGGSAESFAPVRETRTWFQLPGDAAGRALDLSHEYWPGDPPTLLGVPQGPSTEVEATEALPPGLVLRQEEYARDGSVREGRPCTVTENRYGVRVEAPPGVGEPQPPRVFPHLLARRSTCWERGNDPMTRVTFLDDYDAYGQPRSRLHVAVPRGRDFRRAGPAGDPYLAEQVQTDYARRDAAEAFIVDRVASTTRYEILNDGSPTLNDLRASARDGSASRRILGQTLHFYDGPAFEGLPFGQVGIHGALVRSEKLVLTEEILREAYGIPVPSADETPPYLTPSGDPVWTADYPQGFRDRLPLRAGYNFHAGGEGSPYLAGDYATTVQRGYDFQVEPNGHGRGFVRTLCDPFGQRTTVVPDAYDLFPAAWTDPVGLTTRVSHDYRVFQPCEWTDPNGNQARYMFSPLGFLESVAYLGKPDRLEGDSPAVPGVSYRYDWLAHVGGGQPVSVRTLQRVYPVNDADAPADERDTVIESAVYSDGSGRLLQRRTRTAEPGIADLGLSEDESAPVGDLLFRPPEAGAPPRVVVNDWKVLDLRGREVEHYIPFFSTGWDIDPPREAVLGRKVRTYYGPSGEAARTVNPDGSEWRVLRGVPGSIASPDLREPEHYEPTPWEVYLYDPADNAGRTHPDAADSRHYWNTPSSALSDALGRVIGTTERNGPEPADGWYACRTWYDLAGHPLMISDALGRTAFRHIHDLRGRLLRVEGIDSGLHQSVWDAAGNEVERRDGKGALRLCAHDGQSRRTHLWARDRADGPVTLRELVIHGDCPESGLPAAHAAGLNLLGRPFQHYDEAGRLTYASYDFRGNVCDKVRAVLRDSVIRSTPEEPEAFFSVDWEAPRGLTLEEHGRRLLEEVGFSTAFRSDALGRVHRFWYPRDADGMRMELRTCYNEGGAVRRLEVDGTTNVSVITYNATAQRTLIAYGNGVMIRHVYDPVTFCLRRSRGERYTERAGARFEPSGMALQDCAYTYDRAGNIRTITTRAAGSGVPGTVLGPDALDRQFAYDALYRLTSATGRAGSGAAALVPWSDPFRTMDSARVHRYGERYEYDAAGNLTRLEHRTADGAGVRIYLHDPLSNRLALVRAEGIDFPYLYDPAGNLLCEAADRRFAWDHENRLRIFSGGAQGAETGARAHYLYDSGGRRVKRVVFPAAGQPETTVYVDGVWTHCRTHGDPATEADTLHVTDGFRRIALIETGGGADRPAVAYHLDDPLDHCGLVLDQTSARVVSEEYTPYGETSLGGSVTKCYRYGGKARDPESGLYYGEARYYAPGLARWVTCDPAGTRDGPNLYQAVHGNPLALRDPLGLYDEGGHYWTVYFLSLLVGYDERDAFRNAFFAWTPDQVVSLDATKVELATEFGRDAGRFFIMRFLTRYYDLDRAFRHRYPHGDRFDLARFLTPILLRYRDVIQIGLHCLDGSFAQAETQARYDLAVQYCTDPVLFGLALHAFGDSYAHRDVDLDRIPDTAPVRMYKVGLGHGTQAFAYFRDYVTRYRSTAERDAEVRFLNHAELMTRTDSEAAGHLPDKIHAYPLTYEAYVMRLFDLLYECAAKSSGGKNRPRLPARHDPLATVPLVNALLRDVRLRGDGLAQPIDLQKMQAGSLAAEYALAMAGVTTDRAQGDVTRQLARQWWNLTLETEYDPYLPTMEWDEYYSRWGLFLLSLLPLPARTPDQLYDYIYHAAEEWMMSRENASQTEEFVGPLPTPGR